VDEIMWTHWPPTLIASAIVNTNTLKRFQHFRLTGQMRMTDSGLRNAARSVGTAR
jgi:hypothetical protein